MPGLDLPTIGIGQSATGGGTQEGYHDELAIDLLEAAVQAEQKIKEADQAGKKEVGRNMDPPQDVATPVASGSVVATTIVDETPEVSGDDGILQSGKPPADSAERDGAHWTGTGCAWDPTTCRRTTECNRGISIRGGN